MPSGSCMRGSLPVRGVLPTARARLLGLCYVPPSVGTDGRVDARLRSWFQRFLSIKLLCMFHLVWAWSAPGGGWLHITAAAATLGMNLPRTARYGTIVWLGIVMALVARSWPYTLNHILLEAVVLGLLVLFPVRFELAGTREAPDDLQLLWLTLLSVWFFAGVQKLVHGYYLNGESMALSLLTDPGGSGRGLRLGLSALSSVLESLGGAGPSAHLAASLDGQPGSLGGLGRAYCITLGGLVVAAELALPVLTLFRRTGRAATIGLGVAQCCVGVLTAELDFALLGLGLIGLGSARAITLRYAVLSFLAILLAFGSTLRWWGA
jgi:hypothetical protein